MASEDAPKEAGTDATTSTDRFEEDGRAHLREVDDGCGCTEVWEHLSERRERGAE